jgi:hypothetical protein
MKEILAPQTGSGKRSIPARFATASGRMLLLWMWTRKTLFVVEDCRS